ADLVVLDAVDVPADLLRRGAAVPLDRVGVEGALQRRVEAAAVVADAVLLVARPARRAAAVQRAPHGVDALHVLHDVDFADAGPVPVVAEVGRAQHPERWPVALRGSTGQVGQLDARLDTQ